MIDFWKEFSYLFSFTFSASSIFQGCLEEIDQTDQDREPQQVELLDRLRYKVRFLFKKFNVKGRWGDNDKLL